MPPLLADAIIDTDIFITPPFFYLFQRGCIDISPIAISRLIFSVTLPSSPLSSPHWGCRWRFTSFEPTAYADTPLRRVIFATLMMLSRLMIIDFHFRWLFSQPLAFFFAITHPLARCCFSYVAAADTLMMMMILILASPADTIATLASSWDAVVYD